MLATGHSALVRMKLSPTGGFFACQDPPRRYPSLACWIFFRERKPPVLAGVSIEALPTTEPSAFFASSALCDAALARGGEEFRSAPLAHLVLPLNKLLPLDFAGQPEIDVTSRGFACRTCRAQINEASLDKITASRLKFNAEGRDTYDGPTTNVRFGSPRAASELGPFIPSITDMRATAAGPLGATNLAPYPPPLRRFHARAGPRSRLQHSRANSAPHPCGC